jgi:hypothetical protein
LMRQEDIKALARLQQDGEAEPSETGLIGQQRRCHPKGVLFFFSTQTCFQRLMAGGDCEQTLC